MVSSSVKNTSELDVGSNEYATKYSLNRILLKLLENDQLLQELYSDIFAGFSIYEYEENEEYQFNDLVWFLDSDKDLHILRCYKSKTSANLSLWRKGQSFESYGWKDLNPNVDVLVDFGLEAKIKSFLAKKFNEHAMDQTLHPHGRISYGGLKASTDISRKIAKVDLSNLDPNRDKNFFPYWTTYLKTSSESPIINGICRRYDNGLMEYEITFRLGYAGIKVVDPDYGTSAQIIETNQLDLTLSRSDKDYFNASSDQSIFMLSGDPGIVATIGDTRQTNRNDYVNVYSAKLDFAEAAMVGTTTSTSFKSADSYMVFAGDVTCQIRDMATGDLCIGSNQMVFCQKEVGSVTALLVTYPGLVNTGKDEYNARNGGLASNSFTCKIIGRWK